MPEGVRDRLRDAIGPIAAGGALVGLLAAGWAGLWLIAPSGRLAAVAAAATAPALIRGLRLPRSGTAAAGAAVLAAIVALGAAAGTNPSLVVRGDGDTWSRLGDIIPEGLGRAASIPLPLAPDRSDALAGMLILVLAGAAALISWQVIVARRPLAAVVAAATGLAYRWTLVPPDHPVFTGVAALIVALAVFRLSGAGPAGPSRGIPGRAITAGVAITSLALAGSVGAARTPDAWWNWESWTFGTGRTTTTLDLAQRYGPLRFPDKPRVVARVAEDTLLPLRAATLDVFDGSGFQASPTETGRARTAGTLDLPADRQGGPRVVRQVISLTTTSIPWLLAGGRPVQVVGIGRRDVSLFDDGTVRVQPKLGPNLTYRVDTLVPDPGIAKLNAAGGYGALDEDLLTIQPGEGAAPVTVPVWSAGAPDLDPEIFGRYASFYRETRRVVAGAQTPYQAVNKVEAYLRSAPFNYDEKTSRPVGTPDLVDFVLVRHRGYCQHFAGAMALMLRMNGIPARVAVGFTTDPGRFDPARHLYDVVDRDAHSWVEVAFPGYGWIPFDPTPGRAVPNSASVSDPDYTPLGLDSQSQAQVSPTSVVPPARDPDTHAPADNSGPQSGAGGSGGRPWWLLAPGILLALLAAPVALKGVRRARRRRGDERERVLGAARELEALCRDAGVPLDPSLTPAERSQVIWRDLGLDVARLYLLASAARFAPAAPEPGSGREAWKLLAQARRRLGWRRRARAGLRLRSLRHLDAPAPV